MMKMYALAIWALSIPAVFCYDAKYDKLDVDAILGDEAQFTAYLNCLLDKGPCTVEHSADFRQIIPEVIQTACEKCSDTQKEKVRKSVKALQERKPKEFLEFKGKYDPTGQYEEKFTAFILGS